MMRLDLTLLSSNQSLQSKCVGLCSNSGAVTKTKLSCAQLNTNKPIGWRLLCLVDYTRLVNDESPELVSIKVSFESDEIFLDLLRSEVCVTCTSPVLAPDDFAGFFGVARPCDATEGHILKCAFCLNRSARGM